MKTFKDLVMSSTNGGYADSSGRVDFDNGYSISVIQGGGAYTDGDDEYEVAVLKDGDLCYSTPITSDVLGHQSADDVTKVMAQVQSL